MLDVCPMCGHGKKYVSTHVATMDEINRQVFATRPDGGDSLREALEIANDLPRNYRTPAQQALIDEALNG